MNKIAIMKHKKYYIVRTITKNNLINNTLNFDTIFFFKSSKEFAAIPFLIVLFDSKQILNPFMVYFKLFVFISLSLFKAALFNFKRQTSLCLHLNKISNCYRNK